MDGVLCNFESKWFETFGEYPRQSFNKSNWTTFVSQGLFTELDTFPGYQELIDYLQSIKDRKGIRLLILTSSGGFDFHGEVTGQKIAWLQRQGIWNLLHPIVVPGRRFKKHFADPSSFLLDDHPENCAQFIDAGGVAHEYKVAADGIKAIESFLSK